MSHNDYEKEPVPGLPEHLPDGEYIVWQGKPDRSGFLRNVLRGRLIAAYFGFLVVWRVCTGIYDGKGIADTATSASWALALGGIVLAMAWWFARAVERTTIYTITNKRVVSRFGVALPITFNFPFSQIVAADVLHLENGRGTITLSLKEHTRISWAILWPHVRPWKLASPQPALRAIGNVNHVSHLLADGLRAAHDLQPAKVTAVEARPQNDQNPAAANRAGGLQLEGV